jgi:CSLREA domain-containing protein
MNIRIVAAAIALCAWVSGLSAAIFTVNDGDVTGLAAAITMANTNGEDDVINLAANGTYMLMTVNNAETGPNGLPLLRTDGGHTLTINGNRTTITRPFSASSFRIFQIAASANVTMNGLIISGGSITETLGFPALGGGINVNSGTLTLLNCTVTGNSASNTQTSAAVASGGGIYNKSGTLTLRNSTLRSNSVSTRSNNGSSSISSGGAIENFDGTVRLSNCTISGNSTAASSGSGMMGLPNASGAAISNFGSAAGNGSVTMNSCTFVQNFSTNSGGFLGGPSIAIENGGPTANITFGNCILQDVMFSNFQGMITSAGYNVCSGNGGGFLLGTADQINMNAMLGGLGLHGGGRTETHQPLPGSPAIDKGKRDAVPALAVNVDQTGLARPFDYPGVGPAPGGDSSDIGAVEMNEFAQTGNIFTVNTLDDHNDLLCGTEDCSLRDALKAAADQAGTDTIRFAVNLMGDIALKTALPIIATDVNIEGPGADVVTVRRDATQEFRIFNIDGGTVSISGLTISNGKLTPTGSLGAGIYNDAGALTLTSCTLSGNQGYAGGGVYNGGGSATVRNCSFSGNTANEGAGIDNAAVATTSSMTVTNSTFSGNTAANNGGGITNGAFAGAATTTLVNCTFSGNNAPSGSAVSNGASTFGGTPATATTFVINTIFNQGTTAANFANSGGTNAAASIISDGHNISSDAAGGPTGTAPGGFLNGTGDLRNTDPKLSPAGLADNGGGTRTIALDPTSPAINNAGAGAPARDQRDYTRNGAADIGAFELGGKIAVTLGNISTRVRVETGDNVLIGGFIITGTQNKRIIVRAIGPSLPVPGTLANPKLQLFNASGMIGANDDWRSDQQAEIMATGIAPTNDREAALIKTVPPGGYTVIVSGVGGSTGVGLVEVHDLDLTTNSRFANISSRALVQTGDNVLIGGFIISGQDMQKVVIRAIGPSLTALGVPGALQDPTLELHDAMGNVTTNDDWQATQATEISATELAPNDPRESAILATLAPGGYTAIVRGKAGTIGVGLVEVYTAR